jgi:hypothetical protein
VKPRLLDGAVIERGSQQAVFDSRLGGKDKHGSKYRDKKTGHFVPAPKVPPCPPHYWLINEGNVGYCKKCGAVRDFSKEMAKHLKKSFRQPPYIKGSEREEYE